MIEAGGTSPGPRIGTTLQEFRGKLFLFGGIRTMSLTDKALNDLYMFCIRKNCNYLTLSYPIETNTWTQIQTFHQPPPRYAHTSVIWENKFYILGGTDTKWQNEFDVWYLDLDSMNQTFGLLLYNNNFQV